MPHEHRAGHDKLLEAVGAHAGDQFFGYAGAFTSSIRGGNQLCVELRAECSQGRDEAA